MKAVGKIIQKDMKNLLRDKASALIVILGPLMVIFLAGIAFDNTQQYALNIGVYSSSYNELTNTFIASLQEGALSVKKMKSETECIEKIKEGEIHTCIVFPPDLSTTSAKVDEIVFYVDYSRVNLVWAIINTFTSKLEAEASEISLSLTETLVNKIQEMKQTITNTQPTVINMQTRSQDLQNRVNKVKAQLQGMDLSSQLDVSSLSTVETQTQSVMTALQKRVKEAKDMIKAAREKIGASSDNSTQDIKNNLNEIERRLDDINTLATGGTIDGASLGQINTLITEVKNQISGVQSKLVALQTTRNSAVAELDAINGLLTQSLADIQGVKGNLDNAFASLQAISVIDPTKIVTPIRTNIKPVSAQRTSLNYIFPTLIALVIMFIAIILSSTVIMMERYSPAYFRNFISPTNRIVFLLAAFITNFILVAIQAAIILAISAYFFRAEILASLAETTGLLIIITAMFVSIGMLVGYTFKSEETGTLGAISVGSVFLFLSNVILPIEAMPVAIREAAIYNPFVISENLLRQIILYKPPFETIKADLYLLVGYAIVAFVLTFLFQKISEKRYYDKITHLIEKKKKAAARADTEKQLKL